MPFSTVDDARNDTLRDEDLLNLAADTVARIAAPPSPMTPAYQAKAARAERMVFRYLDQTNGGVVSGKTLSGAGSENYANDPAIIRMVTFAMRDDDGGGGSGVRSGRVV